jgi:ATP-dependent helicase YprA (DUF1998 family)
MLFGALLLAALELVSTCDCTSATGCPNCIQVKLLYINFRVFDLVCLAHILFFSPVADMQ